MTPPLDDLRDALRRFADERDWAQFHSPKNLACALSVEAGELLERFQWLSEERSRMLSDAERAAVGAEVADVFLYLLQLADKLDLDLVDAAKKKLAINAEKYPIAQARGTAKKYTEL
jgi:dCTP diphosphatase